ncbi:MAG: hypothetical protein ACOYMF_00140 [Bacteroidales bacterium]
MSYKDCPHYEELVQLLSENRDFEDISFELNDTQNCKECSQSKAKVCTLWVALSFVENMKPQLGLSEAKLTIDNLDEQMKKIAFELIKKSTTKKGDINK